jgi:predicted AAA+ superfamily ATPase
MEHRYLTPSVSRDLEKKMVFIAGARQVGKTTLARKILGKGPGYLNWDIPVHRSAILAGELPVSDLWIFDEIHKYRNWRNFLKGVFDEWKNSKKILVTGSARLDHYRFGGDSLQGRYHFFRLHQFSAAELKLKTGRDLAALMALSGFPEPYTSGSEKEARRWSREYRSIIVHEEINSLEHVMDLGTLELLVERLPRLVGSPLSINALREDLQVSHKTVAHWLEILERLYLIVRLSPFGAKAIRAVKKERKHYHYDWTVVGDAGKRFENMVAMHLLKWVHFREDEDGADVKLKYFRDIDGRETDFVIEEDGAPRYLVETKLADDEIAKGLLYLKARFPKAEAWQISLNGKKDYLSRDGVRVAPAITFLSELV